MRRIAKPRQNPPLVHDVAQDSHMSSARRRRAWASGFS
jgi:hypothetical protein